MTHDEKLRETIDQIAEEVRRTRSAMMHNVLTANNPITFAPYTTFAEPLPNYKFRRVFAWTPRRITSGGIVWMKHYWLRMREDPDHNFHMGSPAWVADARLTDVEYADYILTL